MFNYSNSFSCCICVFTLFGLAACDSGKKEGSNITNVNKPDVSSSSVPVHPVTKMAQEKGKVFAEKVSKDWNVIVTQDSLTLDNKRVLIGNQKNNKVWFEIKAECTNDGGANFEVSLYNVRAQNDGLHAGVKPHKITMLFNDTASTEISSKEISSNYSNQFRIGTVYYGLHNWKIIPELRDIGSNYINASKQVILNEKPPNLPVDGSLDPILDLWNAKMTEYINDQFQKDRGVVFLQQKFGINNFELHTDFWNHLDDEAYRLSMSFDTSLGPAAFHLPYYNSDVRRFIRSCAKDETLKVKEALYIKWLKDNQGGEASATASPPVPTVSCSFCDQNSSASPDASENSAPQTSPTN